MSDQRRWPRMILHLEVSLRFPSVDEAAAARTVDVSRDGVFLTMDPPKPIGTTVRLQVSVGANEVIELEGVVVRAVPDGAEAEPAEAHGVGVFLTRAGPGWDAFVDALTARRAAGPAEPSVVLVERVRKTPGDR